MTQPQQQTPQTSTDAYLEAIRNNLRSIRAIMMFWSVLAGIGLAFWLLALLIAANSPYPY